MTVKEFAESTAATWNNQSRELNIRHALLGISSEIGELQSALKKKVGYGAEIDRANVNEELGDLFYFIVQLWREFDGKILDGIAIDYPADYFDYVREDLLPSVDNIEYFVYDMAKRAADLSVFIFDATQENKINWSSIAISIVRKLKELSGFARTLAINFGIPLSECFRINHEKRAKRFPEKFSQFHALNRDLSAEREILEKVNAPEVVSPVYGDCSEDCACTMTCEKRDRARYGSPAKNGGSLAPDPKREILPPSV